MKRSTAIVAAIVAVAVIVAAAVGVMLLNPGGDSGGDQGPGTTPDGRPSGPEGTVNGAVVNIGMNESNASAFDELKRDFDNTSDAVEEPDALCQVAITNNQTESIKLDCSNFSATLREGGEVQSLNRNMVTVESNTTAYLVLGFKTNGSLITEITYKGDVKIGKMSVMSGLQQKLGPIVMMKAPENLTEIDNLTFESPSAWMITNGSMNSPMLLFFMKNESVILAVVIGTNNNTTAVTLAPTNFWLDLGNGTWVQAEGGRNNNLMKTLEPNSTKPFLLGFRVNETVMPTSIVFWPDQKSNQTVTFAISPQQPPQEPGRLALNKIWDEKSNNTTGSRLFVSLNDTSGAPSGNVALMGWSMKEGLIEANTTHSNMTNGTVYVFDLAKGDDITLLQYNDGGQTRYLWVRPVVPS